MSALHKPVGATIEWLQKQIERGKTDRIHFPDVSFSPKVMRFVLDHLNARNRKPRPGFIDRYALMMATPGRWLEPESEIKFGWDGKLNNGQTRLYAGIKAGRPVRFAVTFGCDPQAHGGNMPTANWSAKETLERAGIANPKVVSGVAKVLVNIEKGVPWSLKIVENDVLEAKGHELETAGIEADISAARSINGQLKKSRVSIRALAAAIHLIRTTSAHAGQLDDFIDKLTYGTNLTKKTDPILVLREGLRDQQWTDLKQAGAVVLAWNAVVQGKAGSVVKLTPGSEFPEVL